MRLQKKNEVTTFNKTDKVAPIENNIDNVYNPYDSSNGRNDMEANQNITPYRDDVINYPEGNRLINENNMKDAQEKLIHK